MSKMHLHVLDTQSGTWQPATVGNETGALFGGGGSTASHLDWSYAAASGGITDTSDVTLVAAPTSGNVNYLTALQMRNADASVATEVVIKSGSDVLWRIDLDANSPLLSVVFPQPLRAAEATALTAACITTSSETYINAQGYQSRDVEEVYAEYGTDVIELYTTDGDRVYAADATTTIDVA